MSAFLESLNTSHWIAIVAIATAIFFGSFTVANYLAGRRERVAKERETTAIVKATINGTYYEHGWRSVQLHIVAASAKPKEFDYYSWRIEHARLLSPRSAVLARADNDDYATGVFYPDLPLRELKGKAKGPQRFALEFFIRFKDRDLGAVARFKVRFSNVHTGVVRTTKVAATLPDNAQYAPEFTATGKG